MKVHLFAVAAGLVVLAATGCVNRPAQEQAKKTAEVLGNPAHAVTVQPAATTTLTETLTITGDVTAGEDTTIGAKNSGKVVSVLVKDGDQVAAGQLLAQLDTTALDAQLQQAQAQVSQSLATASSARAALMQATRNAAAGPQKTSAALRQAQAQVRAAQAGLQKAEAGARPEERRQAEANLTSAKSTLDTQKSELARIKTLVAEGALAGNRLDQQANAVATAQAQYDNAQQAVNLIRNGTRTEDIEAAKEQVRIAQEAVQTAKAAKELDPLLRDQVDAAKAQIESARAGLQSAQAAVRIAQQAIEDAQIRAPFAGKVMGRPIQAGTIAGNGTAIARIIGGAGVYYSGQVPSSEVGRIRQGMPVTVTVDGLPNRTFHGTVAAVSALAQSVGRLFDVRVALTEGMDVIKPGMFARGAVEVNHISDATVVAEQAILTDGKQSYVYTVQGDKAKRANVTTGLHQGDLIQVTGLPVGAPVVVEGQGDLAPEAPVTVTAKPKNQAKREVGAAEG